MNSQNKYDSGIVSINKLLIRLLMGILTLCLVLATIDLMLIIWNDITAPPVLLIDVKTLFDTFSLILTVAVGYELIKSMHTIVTSHASIPALPLVQIAIIAVANKIITLDPHHVDPMLVFGLSTVMLALGITIYFLRRRSTKNTSPTLETP